MPAAAAAAHLVAPPTLHGPLADALGAAGVALVDDPTAPVLAVAVGAEPADGTDAWLRDSRPHLLAALDAEELRLGPFVVPGVTACLRCLDADQPAMPVRRVRPAGPPAPPLVVLAAGWLAEDVRRWHDGVRPTTWSATVHVGADLRPVRRTWLRHPHCGCSWGLAAHPA